MKPAPPVTRTRSVMAERQVSQAGSARHRIRQHAPEVEDDRVRRHLPEQPGGVQVAVTGMVRQEHECVRIPQALVQPDRTVPEGSDLFGPYEVVDRPILLDDGTEVEAQDVLGLGATLTRFVNDEGDPDSPGSVFIESMQAWFDSCWDKLSEPA